MKTKTIDGPVALNGRFLITDPCYVYGDCWTEFCKALGWPITAVAAWPT